MPTYVYKCDSCGAQFEQFQSFKDDPLRTCPACASAIRRVFQPVGIVFKGSGWYITDSRKSSAASVSSDEAKTDKPETKTDNGATETKTETTETKTETKSDTKSDTKTETKSEGTKPAPASDTKSSASTSAPA